mmetsp:Transcript_22882/g.58344  ORF Transcript_22882/g.58344 Transcript_22882/m.58344 type:complete len:587 (-) Transcript_22882:344-2104(-)
METAISRRPTGSFGGASTLGTKSVPSNSAQSDAYLSELLSYSLDRLRKEPDLLRDEKAQVERALQTTAVTQYGAFIETARCLTVMSDELSSVCGHLDRVLEGIPELASTCESFSAQSGAVLDAHAQNKHLAANQSALLELLEVPSLMDTCVRNAVYDEALDLQAFISRLGLLHPDVPVVKLLMAQVAAVGQTMLQQLLARLKASIQLPECLRVMGYLRRIAAFSEADLRLQFLQCRDEWVSSLVEELDEGDSYEYVKHLTDVHRLHLFDAVMQYRAVFFDAAGAAAASGTGPGGPGVSATLGASALGGTSPAQDAVALAAAVKESAMLHSWVQHRVSLYLAALRAHLPNITEGGNLASVLEHCMYCASSLARVGLDFQGLLAPLFEGCALSLLTAHLAGAVEAFNAKLESHKWVPLPGPMLAKARSERALAPGSTSQAGLAAAAEGALTAPEGGEGAEGRTSGGGNNAPEDLAPPYVIMEHFPLAVLTNGVLTALNELRQCAMAGLSKPAAGLLSQALEHAAASLMHYRHTHALADSEAALFGSATRAALDVVLPYVASCYARIFPGSKLDTSSTAAMLRSVLQEG